MTALIEVDNKLFVTAKASVVEDGFDSASWISEKIIHHPGHRWILGRYVEADNPNSNMQYWSLESLWASYHTIWNTAMNINHVQTDVVGAWNYSDIIYPDSADSGINPYVEALGVFWQARFPDLYEDVAKAYSTGQLYVSMECTAESITCGGDNGCGATFEYRGPFDASYCSHIRDRSAYRSFNNPVFHGGALIMPGTQPGWSGAWVKDLSKAERDLIMEQLSGIDADGDVADWERSMWAIQMAAIQRRAK